MKYFCSVRKFPFQLKIIINKILPRRGGVWIEENGRRMWSCVCMRERGWGKEYQKRRCKNKCKKKEEARQMKKRQRMR